MIESSETPATDAAPKAGTDAGERDPREVRASRRLEMLERLAEMGMQLAMDLCQRVGEGMSRGEPLEGAAVALEYSRLARAVRQTQALAARLDQDRDALAKMFAAERAAREKAREDHIEAQRRTVRNAIQGAVNRAGGPQRKIHQAFEVLHERLEDPREDDDFADLPLSALIARVCADIGVTPDWDLWKNEPWAAAEWRAATPGSPYAPMAGEGEAVALRDAVRPRRLSG